MVSFAYAALDVYDEIGDRAAKINRIGFGRNFFGWTQTVMLEKLFLEICKLYSDKKTDYSLYKLLKNLPYIECSG